MFFLVTSGGDGTADVAAGVAADGANATMVASLESCN